tara:strand:- start:850 stop:1278 length:429 start_codon:yes stop_codon:yes gene_type:complete
MSLKKIGYHIVKGKCVKVYSLKKKNRAGKLVTKKVNYKRKVIKKGTKIYKTKASCMKALKRKMKKTKSKGKKRVKKSVRNSKSRFGKSSCTYEVPYFGTMVPSIGKTWSGTLNSGISSNAWGWPTPPGAQSYDKQQGVWNKH